LNPSSCVSVCDIIPEALTGNWQRKIKGKQTCLHFKQIFHNHQIPTANTSNCLSLLDQHKCLSSETIQQPEVPSERSTQDTTNNYVESIEMGENFWRLAEACK
jgi:hypothetical protein